jgi:plasmid stabilization system protein ParE
MVSIKWTSQAVDDLQEIYFYIARSSRLFAKRQIDKIRNQTNVLKSHPKSGKPVP